MKPYLTLEHVLEEDLPMSQDDIDQVAGAQEEDPRAILMRPWNWTSAKKISR
jgi:ribosome recycling factor